MAEQQEPCKPSEISSHVQNRKGLFENVRDIVAQAAPRMQLRDHHENSQYVNKGTSNEFDSTTASTPVVAQPDVSRPDVPHAGNGADEKGYEDISSDSDTDPMDAVMRDLDRQEVNDDSDDDDDEDFAKGLLTDLQAFVSANEETSGKIRPFLAESINQGLQKMANQKKLKEVADRYKRPENCDFLLTPRVNQDIWLQAKPYTKNRDTKWQGIQNEVVKAMMPMIQVTNDLMVAAIDKGQVNVRELLKKSSDSIKLMTASISIMNQRRRENFRPDLTGAYKRLCSAQLPTTNWLFGDDLSKHIKDISESSMIGQKIGHPQKSKFDNHSRPHPYKNWKANKGGKNRHSGNQQHHSKAFNHGEPQYFLGKKRGRGDKRF
ncbi:uncharacterized protein LOC124284012 [Haliotis rubra]|uniref:uncharacterized protein LOC124284012 n=1 Tax=Haliotis rubra TaxID=36100 RepID=UPI001EE58854|nr:uncharacterized protein LOC124284012 [Haliotis rubra]